MKRSSILIVLFTLCAIFSGAQKSLAVPKLEVIGGTNFDFGIVNGNQTITHEFVLNNHGDSVLHILKAKGG